MKFQGIVLAGGKSSRFGEDKALAFAGGATLLETAVSLLDGLGLEPAVITNAWRDYSFLSCPVLRDLIPDKGPLGGLYTACQMFKGASLLTLTCDMPGLEPPMLRTLMRCHDGRNGATVFCTRDGSVHPFPGIYESSLSELILSVMEKSQLSVYSLLEGLTGKRVVTSTLSSQVFLNVNDKKEFSRWVDNCDRMDREFKIRTDPVRA